ncbi:MAG TPA: ankyrin repeat domain-containing protein [Terriglobia bacterium]|jgi:ankyrin repeat protein
MDAKFHPAIAAIKSDDIEGFRQCLRDDPALATTRSHTSHPTLLQCLVLSGTNLVNKVEMARLLIGAGANVNEPLVACGSCDNVEVAELLLESGAAVDGTTGWSPLEEALYWNNQGVVDLLVRRGAAIRNLRCAAGLGRTDLIEGCFSKDGTLKPEAGKINWPWGDLESIAKSNFNAAGKESLASRFASWKNDRQSVLNNAFVYACIGGHIPAARLLLSKGAEIDAIPGGFDYAGTGLHFAAYFGRRAMAEWLIGQGGDPYIKDTKVAGTAAEWAEAGRHPELSAYLKGARRG